MPPGRVLIRYGQWGYKDGMGWIASLGRRSASGLSGFGDWCRFCGQTFSWLPSVGGRRGAQLLAPQFYYVGTRSVPVVVITGAFIGAVLAVQAVVQFKAIGMEHRMGAIVIHSTLKELGPVLAGIMLAGRVGGGLTAELGTMRVTEQIDALRAIGADPIRVLVVPRFVACVLLIPVLVVYANFMGIMGGYAISVYVYGIPAGAFWRTPVETWDIFYGIIKSVFFGGITSLICCYKGFRCAPGAAGVGRACTESFVASCMAILAVDFFLGMLLNALYEYFYGVQIVL